MKSSRVHHGRRSLLERHGLVGYALGELQVLVENIHLLLELVLRRGLLLLLYFESEFLMLHHQFMTLGEQLVFVHLDGEDVFV